MRYRIQAPGRGFSGESLGVSFDQGVGHTDDVTKERRAALEYFRRRGYTVTQVVEDEPQQGEPEVEPAEPAAPFDPSEYTADEVLAYLDRHEDEDTRSAEFDRVIVAERGGKNRKTILARAGANEGDPQ